MHFLVDGHWAVHMDCSRGACLKWVLPALMDPVLGCDGWRCGALEYTSSFVLHTLQLSDSSSPSVPLSSLPWAVICWGLFRLGRWDMAAPCNVWARPIKKTCRQSKEGELRRKSLDSIFHWIPPWKMSNQILQNCSSYFRFLLNIYVTTNAVIVFFLEENYRFATIKHGCRRKCWDVSLLRERGTTRVFHSMDTYHLPPP